jgi:hypothetical protein
MMLMGVMCWLVLSVYNPMWGWLSGNMWEGRTTWGQPPSAVPPGEARQDFAASSRARFALILAATKTACLISLLTPLLWTTWRPDWLPWPLESYINGVHNLGTPQAWLFPIFPWTGFAFAGLAVGFILQSDWTRTRQALVFFSCGAAGLILIQLSRWLDALPRQIYPIYDYWHTSPEFFLIRVGMLMLIVTASYAWCRWGAAQWGFSPLIQLGQASLVVYWVHIEFVYGRVSILPKRAQTIGTATAGWVVITVAMIIMAYIRTNAKGWMKKYSPGARGESPPVPLAGGPAAL